MCRTMGIRMGMLRRAAPRERTWLNRKCRAMGCVEKRTPLRPRLHWHFCSFRDMSSSQSRVAEATSTSSLIPCRHRSRGHVHCEQRLNQQYEYRPRTDSKVCFGSERGPALGQGGSAQGTWVCRPVRQGRDAPVGGRRQIQSRMTEGSPACVGALTSDHSRDARKGDS